ncbi:hypothetical protein Sru01_23940 [Sphaerisporangium rufum]|uniref:DUF4190 domain-containing protein n=1 Tax=Sphaerisporangium rufum TaxID=1381558 RepID=A0A919V0G8_9ACTN|nr:DUF4190 domain-containing protein [Sphaerisporangium rufum]GII77412.1 hypothetical protein Sru01_23940 [Sphaerisporangium rufum]
MTTPGDPNQPDPRDEWPGAEPRPEGEPPGGPRPGGRPAPGGGPPEGEPHHPPPEPHQPPEPYQPPEPHRPPPEPPAEPYRPPAGPPGEPYPPSAGPPAYGEPGGPAYGPQYGERYGERHAAGPPPYGTPYGAPPGAGRQPPEGWPTGARPGGGLGTAALVLGIVSILLLVVCGIGVLVALAGLVVGFVALAKNSNRGRAITGLVLSGLTLLLAIIGFGWFFNNFSECLNLPTQAEVQQCVERKLGIEVGNPAP